MREREHHRLIQDALRCSGRRDPALHTPEDVVELGHRPGQVTPQPDEAFEAVDARRRQVVYQFGVVLKAASRGDTRLQAHARRQS